jgi:hypothetical protein
MGRGALRVYRIEGQRADDRSRDHRVLPRTYVRFQDAIGGGVRTDSEDIKGKNSKIHTAQPSSFGEGDFGLKEK